MPDITQKRSGQDSPGPWKRKKLKLTRTEVVEIDVSEALPDVRLQELAEEATKEMNEMGFGLAPQVIPTSPPARSPAVPSWASVGVFAISTLVLGGSAYLLVSKGFDTLLAAAQSSEGSGEVGRAMGEYLKSLAPFIRTVFGGAILGGISYKIWRRSRRPTR